jgi:molecular chaperone DnaK (HSP70)
MLERLAALAGERLTRLTVDRRIRVVGIDLGTTNSTVAELTVEPDLKELPSVSCLPVDQETTQGRYSHVLVPSVVAIYQDRKWVGQGAKLLRSNPSANLEEYRNLFAECKNDMGLKRTYHRAPVGFKSAKAIASHVLEFLFQAARGDGDAVARTVITVPASFQAAQRSDTVDAAERAHIQLFSGALLDEPVAAFLDYICSHAPLESGAMNLPASGETRNLLVFDFGGGTCDVALFRLGRDVSEGLTIEPLSVSRYHRLGGGDIDRAIIHEILLPQLLSQNSLDPFALSFEEKRLRIQPALLTVAEALKEKMCKEISRQKSLGLWDPAKAPAIIQRVPGQHVISLGERKLVLQSPQMTGAQFETILQPFLDTDLPYPREDEYRLTCSIFAPIMDALLRANKETEEIHLCLLAGGSSLIPHVREALASHFASAQLLTFPKGDDTQVAVARGAAIHAMGLQLFGRPLIQPICHDDICFRTRGGHAVLIGKGEHLPFPRDKEWERREDFTVPETVLTGDARIRVEICSGREQEPVFAKTWSIPAPVHQGDPLWLDYRYDENQVLHLQLSRKNSPGVFSTQIENPLTHVVNPNKTRAAIDEIEERMRCGVVPKEDFADTFFELGDLYRRLGQREKALANYSRSLQVAGEPSAAVLNKMALCAREIGDRNRAEQFYEEAARAEEWDGTFFNWALAREAWGDAAGALGLVERALALQNDPAYLVVQARLFQRVGKAPERDSALQSALDSFGAIDGLSEFHLVWLEIGAKMAGRKQLADAAEKQFRERRRKTELPEETDGEVPGIRE